MIPALIFTFVCLAIGLWLRVKVRVLQWIFVPASIVAGIVGLIVIQVAVVARARSDESVVLDWLGRDLADELSTWPGWLIAVVFAGMFLERQSRPMLESFRLAGREGLVVWIVVLGQTAVGLLATWLLIQPFFDVPNSFGVLIETGFAGGHGTASAMGAVLESETVGMENGRDLGTFMATVGLVFSVISGVVYVNLAIRARWTQRTADGLPLVTGLEDRNEKPTIARGTVRSDVLEPLLFQAIPLALAFAIGIALQTGVSAMAAAVDTTLGNNADVADEEADAIDEEGGDDAKADTTSDSPVKDPLAARTSVSGVFGSFPLFIYTMFGGLLVRRLMEVCGLGDMIDPASMQRLLGAAMDILVVAAIASLSIYAVVSVWIPLTILIVVAFAWTAFCLLHVARRILPEKYWFELGIINYGMSTGTTATGFVLLKMIDRDLDSGAAEDYALAAPLSAPFIGGGMLTFALPLLVLERVPIAISALTISAIVLGLYVVGRYVGRRSRG